MKLHPRTMKTQLARIDMCKAMVAVATKHDLTFVETVQAIADGIERIARDALQRERHPNNPDKGADQA